MDKQWEDVMTLSRMNIALLMVSTFMWCGAASAGTAVLQLSRVAPLTNVNDAAGLFQHEAGIVLKGAITVGNYFLVRRVETLPGALFNTGATHITLLFAPAKRTTNAPENITIDGAHDFTTGAFKGSVSATSSAYSWVRDADADYTIANSVETLVLRWTGSNQLLVP